MDAVEFVGTAVVLIADDAPAEPVAVVAAHNIGRDGTGFDTDIRLPGDYKTAVVRIGCAGDDAAAKNSIQSCFLPFYHDLSGADSNLRMGFCGI